MNKSLKIIFNALPVLLMIGFIPVVLNDYYLTLFYAIIVIVSFLIKKEKGDILIFFFGFFVMIICEAIFVATGVETFVRNTLFGLMPLWLPVLWGYGFVAIKRALKILEQENQRPKVGIGIMILKDGKVLLGKRKGSHGAGEYSFPGGHLEYMESFEECARREVREECGIEIKNIKFLNVANVDAYAPKHYVNVEIIAEWESGESKVLEPEKIADWQWCSLEKVPEPMFVFARQGIDTLKTGKNYFDLK